MDGRRVDPDTSVPRILRHLSQKVNSQSDRCQPVAARGPGRPIDRRRGVGPSRRRSVGSRGRRWGGPGPTIGGLGLHLRGLALEVVERAFPLGNVAGVGAMLALGGFVPVLGGWLDDRVGRWADVVETLGGVCPSSASGDPDADHGPVLGRADAPELFARGRRDRPTAGARPPGQLRLTYLPCCGATAWGRRGRALLIGLPLLSVLNRVELRAVLAHELAHFGPGGRDARGPIGPVRRQASAGRSTRRAGRRGAPCAAGRGSATALGSRLLAPIARGQEARADRFAAGIAGGDADGLGAWSRSPSSSRSSARCSANTTPRPRRRRTSTPTSAPSGDACPSPLLTAMRHRLLSRAARPHRPRPPGPDRPPRRSSSPTPIGPATGDDLAPAEGVLGDPLALEQMLHNRLFGTVPAPSGRASSTGPAVRSFARRTSPMWDSRRRLSSGPGQPRAAVPHRRGPGPAGMGRATFVDAISAAIGRARAPGDGRPEERNPRIEGATPMPRPLSEQVIVITGASSGIGRETAMRAARAGATVVLAARNEQALRDVAEQIDRTGGRALAIVADVAECVPGRSAGDAGRRTVRPDRHLGQ